MPNLLWPRARTRRARWTGAWVGLVLIAGGILFMAIRAGDGARQRAADKVSTPSAVTSEQR